MSTLFAVALSCVVAVQNPQTDEPPPARTAKISGTVTRRDTSRPLEGVVIRLVRWDGSFGQQIPAKGTDANGRFQFDGLLRGSYSITFSADRFVSLQFGQRTPQEAASRIELTDGQHLRQGRHRAAADDRDRRPSARRVRRSGARVSGFRPRRSSSCRTAAVDAGGQRLDAAAADRRSWTIRVIFNLPPGDYYLVAVAGPFAGAEDPSGFALTYFPGHGAPHGREARQPGTRTGPSGLVFQLTPAPMATDLRRAGGRERQADCWFACRFLATSGDDVRSLIMAGSRLERTARSHSATSRPGRT